MTNTITQLYAVGAASRKNGPSYSDYLALLSNGECVLFHQFTSTTPIQLVTLGEWEMTESKNKLVLTFPAVSQKRLRWYFEADNFKKTHVFEKGFFDDYENENDKLTKTAVEIDRPDELLELYTKEKELLNTQDKETIIQQDLDFAMAFAAQKSLRETRLLALSENMPFFLFGLLIGLPLAIVILGSCIEDGFCATPFAVILYAIMAISFFGLRQFNLNPRCVDYRKKRQGKLLLSILQNKEIVRNIRLDWQRYFDYHIEHPDYIFNAMNNKINFE